MPLTPADVRNKQFSTTRLRPGYDEEEVDAFLDEVEAELDRLIQENEELRAKLGECLRGKVPGGMGMPGSMQMAPAPVAEPKPEMMAPSRSRSNLRSRPPRAGARRHGSAARRGQHGHRGPRARPRPADGRPGDRRRPS
ncbi:hypothetical protein GCM10027612_38830 [Microbispora bryophytorum subsp. camponoti]